MKKLVLFILLIGILFAVPQSNEKGTTNVKNAIIKLNNDARSFVLMMGIIEFFASILLLGGTVLVYHKKIKQKKDTELWVILALVGSAIGIVLLALGLISITTYIMTVPMTEAMIGVTNG